MRMRVDMIVEVPDTWDTTTVESAIENAIEGVEDGGTEVLRIFGSITKRKEIKPRAKRHKGIWVKMANIDGEWVYHTTQDSAATFIRNKSIYNVKRPDVYNALRSRKNRNRLIYDNTLVAYV